VIFCRSTQHSNNKHPFDREQLQKEISKHSFQLHLGFSFPFFWLHRLSLPSRRGLWNPS